MKSVLERLKERFPNELADAYTTPHGDDYIVVKPEALVEVARFCKDDPELDFKMFLDTCAVDRLLLPNNDPRFEINHTIRQGRAPWKKLHIKVFASESNPEVPSLQPVWKGANWWERYTFDFYGIKFTGHPDLRRVLLYDEFQGHPLRKDYPMKGRQPLVAERDFRDIVRGPGSAPPEQT